MLPRRTLAKEPPAGERLTLADAERRSKVRVVRVSGKARLIQRLAALGVVPGVVLTVLRPKGPALVALEGARIAIGRSAAGHVEIEAAE